MSALKRIWNILTTLLVIAAVMLAVALVGVRLIGLRPFTVLSGSMEPTYHTGSLIYVKSVDYRELKAGDPITFMLNEDTVATHRIVEVVPDEEDPETIRYRTKGDRNENVDGGLVHCKNVIGVPVFTIPKLGYVASYITNPPGTYIALSVGAFAILLMFLPELIKTIFTDDEPGKKEKKPEKLPSDTGDKKSFAESRHTDTHTSAKTESIPHSAGDKKRAAENTHTNTYSAAKISGLLLKKKKGKHEL